MAKKITKYLIISLILSLGFGQLLRFDVVGIPLYIHDVCVFSVLILNAGSILKRKDFARLRGIKLICLGLAVGWLRALTLFPLASLAVPFLYTVRIVAYLTLYSLLHKKHILNLMGVTTDFKKIFIVSGLVTVAIGILQYILLPDMRWAQYLGWDDHLGRLTLPHYDPTFTGIMLSLFLIFTVNAKSWYAASLTVPAILLTYSRSVWLALMMTLFIYIPNRVLKIGAILLLVISIFLLPRTFGEGTNLARTFSITSRFSTDMQILHDLKWDLLIGRGYNTFAINQISEKGYPNHAAGPNNSYFMILSTMGIMGAVGWYMFLTDLCTSSRFKPAIVFILIASLFNNILFYPFVILWLFLTETVVSER
jgi:hypothetical protein